MTRQIKAQEAYAEVKKLKKYLPILEDIVVTPDVQSLKIVEKLKKLLKSDSDYQAYNIFTKLSKQEERLFGFVGGYIPMVDFDKIEKILNRLEKDYEKQKGGMFKSTVQDYAKLVLELQSKLEAKDREINDLLEFQASTLNMAADKARITAGTSKKNFENGEETIRKILQNRYRGQSEDIDVEKLRRVFYGKKEEYFNS